MAPWFTPKKKKDDGDVQADDKLIERNMCVKLQVKSNQTVELLKIRHFE